MNYIYKHIDKEILLDHTEDSHQGRACVYVASLEYKGQFIDVAIPFKGEIDFRSLKRDDFVSLNISKVNSQTLSGFIVKKAVPVNVNLVRNFSFMDNDVFLNIAKEITRKENELISKSQAHLRRIGNGENIQFSTNIDEQLKYLNARTLARNNGLSDSYIYSIRPQELYRLVENSNKNIGKNVQFIPPKNNGGQGNGK